MSFAFAGQSWPVSPADFNLGRVDSNGNCLGGIFSLDGEYNKPRHGGPAVPEYIIGDTFLKNTYTVFRYDNPRAVGFAALSQTAKDMDDEPPNAGAGVTKSLAQPSRSTSAATPGARPASLSAAVASVIVLATWLLQ